MVVYYKLGFFILFIFYLYKQSATGHWPTRCAKKQTTINQHKHGANLTRMVHKNTSDRDRKLKRYTVGTKLTTI